MRMRLVQIGNSRGLRLPKVLLEEVGLVDDVEVRARPGQLVITPVTSARTGWKAAAKRLAAAESGLLDGATTTRFDAEEWEWR